MISMITRLSVSTGTIWSAGQRRPVGKSSSTAPASTFKALPEEERADLTKDKAITLMLAQPSMIKRPVLEADGKLLIGFKPEIYAGAFKVDA